MAGTRSSGPEVVRRGVLLSTAFLLPVFFSRAGIDAFDLPRATLAVVAASALLLTGAAGLAVTGQLRVPKTRVLLAAVAFAAAVVVAAVGTDQPWVSVVGEYRRHTGAAPYLAYVVLFVSTLRTFDRRSVPRLVGALLAGLGAVVAYGSIQALDADPLRWGGDYAGTVFSTLGNPNMAAAAAAIAVPLALGGALRRTWPSALRGACGGLAVLAFVVTVATDSLQGPVAAIAGLSVLALAWVLDGTPETVRRAGIGVWLAGSAVVAAVAAAGLGGAGPLAFIGDQRSLTLRSYYWRAAVSMWTERPFRGVGLGLYGSRYHEHRPLAAAIEAPVEVTADAAHSVPLSMFAEGGTLLGIAYVVFVAAVGTMLVRGLRRLQGENLLLLGAVGGAWVAYQVQSLVSIDVPALASVHWFLAAVVVVIGTDPGQHTVRLPWAPVAQKDARGRPRRGRNARRHVDRLAPVLAVAVFLGLLGPLTRPWRADMVAADVEGSTSFGEGLSASRRAISLAPWEATYWYDQGRLLGEAGHLAAAQVAFTEAVQRDPRWIVGLLTNARLATERGEVEEARRHYEHALEVDRQSPDLKAEVGAFELDQGRAARAAELLADATRLARDEPEWWELLGSARQRIGDDEGASEAFSRALRLDPENEVARNALGANR